ncbi:MAG TPA: hypothetical protein VGV93_06490 [Acidimicrobiales bacterium]|nr:hypothetical protein [Acidimicrobiales bacterium]
MAILLVLAPLPAQRGRRVGEEAGASEVTVGWRTCDVSVDRVTDLSWLAATLTVSGRSPG